MFKRIAVVSLAVAALTVVATASAGNGGSAKSSSITDEAADETTQATLPLPEDLRAGATIYKYDVKTGERIVLRKGTNSIECVPRGFAKDHEAAEYLRFRQFLAGREFPPAFAASPRFYAGVVKVFREVAPLTRFLNEALLKD